MEAPNKRLTRDEAAAVIMNALVDRPMPFPYKGGWGQILSDFACISPNTIRNMATKGRRSFEKK